ncbi:ABC transporter ATP-binding protein [Lentzea sp. NPDC054927]
MIAALRATGEIMAAAWRDSPGRMALSVVLMILGGAAAPLLALALRDGINQAVAGDVTGAALTGGVVGALAVCSLMVQHFAFIPYGEAADLVTVTMDSELIELANGSAGLEHHERPDYADEIALLRKEIGQYPDALVGLMALLSLGVSMAFTAWLLASVSPWLMLLPVAALLPVYATHRAQNVQNGARERSATVSRQARNLFELGTGTAPAKEIRVFRLQDEFRRRHRALWADEGRVLARAELRSALIEAAGQLAFSAAYIAAVLLSLRQAISGHGSVGSVVLVIILATQVNRQVNSALEMFRRLQRMTRGMTRLRWLRALIAAQQPPPADAAVPGSILTGIRFTDVAFAYPGTGRASLQEVGLTLPAGSTVAIVGENGAGKTTLVKLLCRFYDATAGAIDLDGTDIRRFPLDAWRARIATGFQDFVRFEVAARHTVGVGDLPFLNDDNAVLAAVDRASAAGVIDQLDRGLATQLGKTYADGRELSGGQWQKLALSRAMMREAPLLLILDEPTSALDAEAEHQLFERYAEHGRRIGEANGTITVLVSHRFSTVKMADLIIVVANGHIAEVGNHAELLELGGTYASLYGLQAEAYQSWRVH